MWVGAQGRDESFEAVESGDDLGWDTEVVGKEALEVGDAEADGGGGGRDLEVLVKQAECVCDAALVSDGDPKAAGQEVDDEREAGGPIASVVEAFWDVSVFTVEELGDGDDVAREL
jgi:hypothetical protein